MRRVVVTGMGMVSPLGMGVEHNWKEIIAGKSGVKKLQGMDMKDVPVTIGGQIIYGQGENEFDADKYVAPKDQRKMDKFIVFGIAACKEAVDDSGFVPADEEEKYRAGVMMAAGIGGLQTIYENSVAFHEGGIKKVSPYFIPASLINLISGHVSIEHQFKGPNHSCVTACSSGTHAIGDAARMISFGDADVMIAGGAESALNPLGLAGFSRIRAVTSIFNENPEKASRPWDQGRDGFVMGEGAGAVVLEELEHAKARGAKIYAEVVGYGMSGDAYHITAPDGDGAYRAMKMASENALKNHGVKLTDIGYINAHGTSTPVGDTMETGAVRKLFGEKISDVSISSTKSSIGHLLGAAGAVEAIYSIKALNEGICPPTLNLENPDEATIGLDLVPLKASRKELKAVMSNSFGFGGTNSSIVLKKFEA